MPILKHLFKAHIKAYVGALKVLKHVTCNCNAEVSIFQQMCCHRRDSSQSNDLIRNPEIRIGYKIKINEAAYLQTNTLKQQTCRDCELGFQTHILPGRVGHHAAVRTFIFLGHPQNLEHPIRKGNEPAADGTKARKNSDNKVS